MTATWALASPLKVLIDPGHGGRDQGAVRGSVIEAEITLAVAKQLDRRLQADKRFRSSLTRTQDHFLSLSDRALLAKTSQADIFVSIHVNANPNSRARGAEFYFQNQLAPDEESMRMAHIENSSDGEPPIFNYPYLEKSKYPADVQAILTDLLDTDRILRSSQLSKALKIGWTRTRKNRLAAIRQAPFYVLSEIKIPSTLVELGFISNPEELKELTQTHVQRQMAEDLHQGLVNYKESLDKKRFNP